MKETEMQTCGEYVESKIAECEKRARADENHRQIMLGAKAGFEMYFEEMTLAEAALPFSEWQRVQRRIARLFAARRLVSKKAHKDGGEK